MPSVSAADDDGAPGTTTASVERRRDSTMSEMSSADEFDVYFKRAAEVAAQAERCRRESESEFDGYFEPSGNGGSRRASASLQQPRQPHHSRTASCKYPHRRATVPTVRHSNSVSPGKDKPEPPSSTSGIGPNWLHTLTTSCTSSHSTTTRIRFQQADDCDDFANFNDPEQVIIPSSAMLQAPGANGRRTSTSFSCRSKSAPHSRSSSWKKSRRPQTGCSPSTCAERRESVSFEEAISAKLNELKLLQADDCYVVRQFDTSSKGALVNRGDSIKRRRRRTGGNAVGGAHRPLPLPEMYQGPSTLSTTAACSNNADICVERETIEGDELVDALRDAVTGDAIAGRPVKVVVMGEEGVGKTALLQQFMTSEYMAAVQTNFDYECEKIVSVLLNSEETILDFVENNDPVIDVEQFDDVDAFVLVFTITAHSSFNFASSVLAEIQQSYGTIPVIFVANKTDLVRTRQVSEEAVRDIYRRCPYYTEVSAALNHKVDELLVTIVTAVRNRQSSAFQVGSGPTAGCGGGDRLLVGSGSSSGRQLSTTPIPLVTTHHPHSSTARNCVRNAAGLLKGLFTRQKGSSAKKSSNKVINDSSRSRENLVD